MAAMPDQRFADALVQDFDVDAFLHDLTYRCVELFQVDSAGVMLADPAGALRVVAATDDTVNLVEQIQDDTNEGPCHDSHRDGRAAVEEDLRVGGAQRWPRFTAEVNHRVDLVAVYALPMRLRHHAIGSLNLFRCAPGPFEPDDVRAAQALADVATIGILQARQISKADIAIGQLQHALDSRVVIEQAKGVLAARLHTSTTDAFDRMRHSARGGGVKLRDVAAAVVTGQDRPPASGRARAG